MSKKYGDYLLTQADCEYYLYYNCRIIDSVSFNQLNNMGKNINQWLIDYLNDVHNKLDKKRQILLNEMTALDMDMANNTKAMIEAGALSNDELLNLIR